MTNFDEFDAESQALLNNLQQGNKFISFENLNIEFSRKESFDTQSFKSFNNLSNEKSQNSPFGKNSLFYNSDFTMDNIDFVKISEYLKQGSDFEYNYEQFIGEDTFIVALINHLVVPIKFDTEIPLVQKTLAGERALQLKGKLYKENGIVNIKSDFDGDRTGGLEFEFDYKRKKIIYKAHYYFIGKQRVYEKNNKDNIAFTISSSNFDDFHTFLSISFRKESDEFLEKIRVTFLNAINDVNYSISQKKSVQINGLDAKNLDWLYQNIPSFVAQELNFDQTIANIFKLHFADITSPITDYTAAITSILQKVNSESVYNYFYKNPKKLISLLNGFDDDSLVKLFCNYITAITFLYTKQNIEEARDFSVSENTHIETNILYGDKEGKVELTNELQLPTIGFTGLNFINLFTEDIEINNPTKKNNQFHPLDLIYISKYDENNEEIEKYPSTALYGKYLGDKSEWSDITDATLAIIDVIGIILSGGALNAGVRGVARLFAIIDISISTINLALLSPDLRNKLNRSEAGRWFVNHWGVISFCASMGTISYYLAKGIIKHHAQLKQQLQNEPELVKQIDDLAQESKRVVDEIDLMAKPPRINEKTGGKLMSESKIRKYKGELRQKGIEPFFEEDLLINKAGKKIQNKATLKKFKPFSDDGILFENPRDFFHFIRKEGYAGGFHAKSKQLFLTENPTEYLAFHERAHVKHYLEIGDEYHTLATWKKETYVFNEIWKNKHSWTEKELEHALNYVNEIRKKAKQPEITKKI